MYVPLFVFAGQKIMEKEGLKGPQYFWLQPDSIILR